MLLLLQLLEMSFNCLEDVESTIPVSPLHLAVSTAGLAPGLWRALGSVRGSRWVLERYPLAGSTGWAPAAVGAERGKGGKVPAAGEQLSPQAIVQSPFDLCVKLLALSRAFWMLLFGVTSLV